MDESNDILTIEETAEYLKIPVSTVYRLAQQGRIPANKVGRQWRFYRPALIEWIGPALPNHLLKPLVRENQPR
jgi:excisionase family DNA binding protein